MKRRKVSCMYKNYVFDLYGTLIDTKKNWNHEYLWEKMSQLYCFHGACYDSDEFKEKFEKYLGKIRENDADDQHVDIDIEDIFFQLFKKKNVKPKNKLVREAARVFLLLITENLEIKAYVNQLIEQLKEQDKNIYIFANGQATFAKNELRAVGLYDAFETIVMSSNTRLKKTNDKAFESFIENQGLKDKKTLIIGRNYQENIDGAAHIGLDSVHIIGKDEEPLNDTKATYTIKEDEILKILEL